MGFKTILRITVGTLFRKPTSHFSVLQTVSNRQLSCLTSNKSAIRKVSIFPTTQTRNSSLNLGVPDENNLKSINSADVKSTFLNPKTVFQLNYCKFQSCMLLGAEIMQNAFFTYWELNLEKEWESDFVTYLFWDEKTEPIWENIKMDTHLALSKAEIIHWSIDILCKIFKRIKVELPYDILEELGAVESNFRAFDHSGNITDEVYADFYRRSSILLIEAGVPLEKIIKHEPYFVEPVTIKVDELNPEVMELKNLGDEALKIKNFKNAIKFYSKAIGLKSCCISNDMLAQLYFNRSVAFGESGDSQSAEKNAKCSNYFSNLEFKVYSSPEAVAYDIRKFFEIESDIDIEEYSRDSYDEERTHSLNFSCDPI